MANPEDILSYWLDDVGPKGWYAGGAKLDADVRERFLPTWENAKAGAYGMWLTYPSGTLAYIILMDQFPRNMFRDTGRAFSSDAAALAASKFAVARGWDMKIDPPARQFFYMPLMHSENLCDQDRCVRLFATRMPESLDNLRHAKAHREIIRRHGRFPTRNAALQRKSTAAEEAYLSGGGYRSALQAVDAA